MYIPFHSEIHLLWFWLLPFPQVQGHIVDTLGLLTMIYDKSLVCINIYFYRLIFGIIYNCVIFSFTNNLEQRWIAREHNVMKVIQGSMKCKEAIKPQWKLVALKRVARLRKYVISHQPAKLSLLKFRNIKSDIVRLVFKLVLMASMQEMLRLNFLRCLHIQVSIVL